MDIEPAFSDVIEDGLNDFDKAANPPLVSSIVANKRYT
jgi:hypothetical protein